MNYKSIVNSEMDGSSFGRKYENAVAGWEAKQNDRGVIYYANETLQITSWNHPYFTKLLEDIEIIYGDIKFAAYRTSLKLRALQIQLGISRISYAGLKQMFAAHLVRNEDNGYLSCSEALAFIQNVLETSNAAEQSDPGLQTAAQLILNFILNLYDINRSGKVCSRSIKNVLTALSGSKLSEKYKYFFLSMKDENQKVSKENLMYFIDDLMQITDVLKESAAYGRNARAAVRSCFHLVKKPEGESITERDFFMWLTQEPQTLVWLPTLHRITATETVQHSVSCKVCAASPIAGLRYRCLVCFKYDLCQGCFLHGHTSHTHKFKHPMKEYCLPTSIADNAKAFLKIVKNKLATQSRCGYRITYLPVDNAEIDSISVRQSLTNLESCQYRSTDSGLAESSSGGETQVQGTQFSQTDGEHQSQKQTSKILEVMGQPCYTSSPMEPDAVSERDKEHEQRQMALTIEQLQRENRLLLQKLQMYQQLCNVENNDSNSFTGENGARNMLGIEDPLEEITTNSLISPVIIENVGADGKLGEQDSDDPQDDYPAHLKVPTVLDIVGAFTPVRSHPSTEFSLEDDRILDEEREHHSSGELAKTNEVHYSSIFRKPAASNLSSAVDQTVSEESTMPNGLVYRLSDMSLDCLDSGEGKADLIGQNSNPDGTGNEGSTTSDGLVYRSSDMSLDILESCGETSIVATEMKNNGITMNGHDSESDLHLVNYSASSSSYELKKNSQLTSQSCHSNESKKHQPSLIFSSACLRANRDTSQKNRSLMETSHNENVCEANSFADKHTRETSHDDSYVAELSEIFSQSKYHFQSGNAHDFLLSNKLTPNKIKTAPRRKTIEPVHMSTPVIKLRELGPKSTLPKKTRSLGLKDRSQSHLDKENRVVTSKNTSVNKSFQTSKQNMETTPVSSLPLWQRKRILMSVNSLPSGYSQSCDNLTMDTENVAGLSVMFKKAEEIGRKIGEDVSLTMETQDKEELQRLMHDLKKDCQSEETENSTEEIVDELRQPADDDSMLEAVLNIGNAMADFVHATAQNQR